MPAGRCIAQWEQSALDEAVVDVFGYQALQLGLPELCGLRANRIRNRWLATPEALARVPADFTGQVQCAFEALPFDSQSMDLVVLPHTLEWADDPHATLREVERVLRPQGRLVITGFNPSSLWAWRQRAGRWRRQALPWWNPPLFLPERGEFLAYRRLRDWLALLSFELGAARFGCFRWPARSQDLLERMAWMEDHGQRWWPVFGAVYAVSAIKCVRGMRLVGLAQRRLKPSGVKAAAAVRRSWRG